jgi:hypothetical protein
MMLQQCHVGEGVMLRWMIWIIVIASAVALCIALLGYPLAWDWIGTSGGFEKITTTSHGTITTIERPQGKTLWDWLQLLVVPVAVALGVAWLTMAQTRIDREHEQRRQDRDHRIDFLRRVTQLNSHVQYARDLVNAHRSALTYRDQSLKLMALRPDIEALILDIQVAGPLFAQQAVFVAQLTAIAQYLQRGTDEYVKHHNTVIDDPRAKNPTEKEDLRNVLKDESIVWMEDFMARGSVYQDEYERNLNAVRDAIRMDVYGT